MAGKYFGKNVSRTTIHRASLPPWVKKETAIATLKRKILKKSSLAKRLKLTRKENQLRKNLVEDQAEFEKIFRGRKFSDLQKYLRSLHKSSRFPETMKYEDEKSNDDAQKNKFFSSFFSNVFLKRNQIDQTRTFAKKTYNHVYVSETKILEILSKLETSKTCGPHNTGNLVLKNLPALSNSLLIVFKAALSKGYFPSFWKISEVFPVFKDEDRADVKQYRPIRFLCSASKVFEKVIFY